MLLKSDLCAHDCAQKLVESQTREAAENIQSFFFLFNCNLNNYYYATVNIISVTFGCPLTDCECARASVCFLCLEAGQATSPPHRVW